VKLQPSGRALAYGTYLGGKETEAAGGIAIDRAGNAYLTGSTQSPDFPLVRPFQPAIGNASCSTTGPPKELCDDAFVTKLSADGQRLGYSTFLGGNAEDQGLGIAVGTDGVAHVAGSTDSRAFRLAAPVQAKIGGGIDAYVAAIGPTGALRSSTYLGGTEAERANAVAVDAGGRVHVAGRTLSPNFPTATPLQGALAGDYDVFVTMLR
jgi:Beta-propeller repeat